ncbi:PQQ-binding-like beta-propeller repeat protein [Acetobacter sp.]|jgi:outer membrane protein assembly factor BamB|uniref:PQQ-binding-like beta-propeller repeat protein n=1 Tax=Acetobacter sp. TaxID=440 RepID=UPI0025B7F09F|nr:PQQ-binding-like beta-propeller repeat protein [Acetobacter sp.]MCH4090050.1 PQQ-like beta-propeller repeat protein [Acetobacter sp.]MCI1298746.1 PQQ-like beta-propeller repeat protein [Acetobacter sp.]MCI1315311.1 PQQ-like beta-propeller repeat protein [Acetobacter sp.]
MHLPPSDSRRSFLRKLLTGAALVPLGGCHLFEDDKKPLVVGHRVPVLPAHGGLTVTRSKEALTPITLPSPVAMTEWPMSGRTPSHVGTNYAWGGLKRRWTRSIGQGTSAPDFLAFAALGSNGQSVLQASPVIQGGRIFTLDAAGDVRAFTWPGMNHLWTFNPKPHRMKSSNLGGGLGVNGDTLYIVDGIAETVAVEVETGKVKWRANVGTPGRSAPTIAKNRVFFSTIDARLFALDATSGHQLWTYAASMAPTVMFGAPAPAVVDGIVLAGFGSGDIVALREESGEVVWSDTLGAATGMSAAGDFSCIRSLPVIQNGTAYAMSVSASLVAFDMRSGRRLWERAVAGACPLLVVQDWLYLITLDGQVACLDRITGQVRWITQLRQYSRVDAQKDGVAWTGPVLADGKLLCVSTLPENGIVSLDPVTGKILSIDPLPAPTSVEPIFSDGHMLIIDNRGDLNSYG